MNNTTTGHVLTELSLEELQLKDQITSEIASRQQVSRVVFTHPCFNSSTYHHQKHKHWAKLVKAVDVTKNSGYAFSGEFFDVQREHKVPEGPIIATVCDREATLWHVTADGVIEVCSCKTNAMSKLIDKCASMI